MIKSNLNHNQRSFDMPSLENLLENISQNGDMEHLQGQYTSLEVQTAMLQAFSIFMKDDDKSLMQLYEKIKQLHKDKEITFWEQWRNIVRKTSYEQDKFIQKRFWQNAVLENVKILINSDNCEKYEKEADFDGWNEYMTAFRLLELTEKAVKNVKEHSEGLMMFLKRVNSQLSDPKNRRFWSYAGIERIRNEVKSFESFIYDHLELATLPSHCPKSPGVRALIKRRESATPPSIQDTSIVAKETGDVGVTTTALGGQQENLQKELDTENQTSRIILLFVTDYFFQIVMIVLAVTLKYILPKEHLLLREIETENGSITHKMTPIQIYWYVLFLGFVTWYIVIPAMQWANLLKKAPEIPTDQSGVSEAAKAKALAESTPGTDNSNKPSEDCSGKDSDEEQVDQPSDKPPTCNFL